MTSFIPRGLLLLACMLTLTAGLTRAIAAQPQLKPSQPEQASDDVTAPSRLIVTSDLWLGGPKRSGHAWSLLPQGPGVADVVHLPARGDGPRARAGAARLVLPVMGLYSHAAAWDGRLYLLTVGGTDAQAKRTLWTHAASAMITPGSWTYTPAGRLEALAPLTGDGRVIGLIGTARGPAALLALDPTNPYVTGDTPPERWRLAILDIDRWVELPLPPGTAQAEALVLLADQRGLALGAMLQPLAGQVPRLALHVGEFTRPTGPSDATKPAQSIDTAASISAPPAEDLSPGAAPRAVRRAAARDQDRDASSTPVPIALTVTWPATPAAEVDLPASVASSMVTFLEQPAAPSGAPSAVASPVADGLRTDVLRVDGRLYAALVQLAPDSGLAPESGAARSADPQSPAVGGAKVGPPGALEVLIYDLRPSDRGQGFSGSTANSDKTPTPQQAPLARLRVPGPLVGVAGLDGLSRLAVISATAPRTTQRARGSLLARGPIPDIARLSVTEVSLASGLVMADATAAHADGPVSRHDMQMLWLVLLGIGAVTLVFVVRSDGPTSVSLPPHCSLGTPGRRMFAGAIDLMVGLTLVGVALGQSPIGLLSVQSLASGGLAPLLGALMACCVHCTVSEALFGRSIGKFAMGLRVSSMRRAGPAGVASNTPTTTASITPTSGPAWVPGEPTFGQALVRNLVRWCLPPIGMMMFLDGSFRHAGDLLAKTLVVLPDVPVDPPDEP